MSANLNVNLVSSNAVKDLMAQHNSTPKRLIRIGRLASVRHKTVCTTPVSFFTDKIHMEKYVSLATGRRCPVQVRLDAIN